MEGRKKEIVPTEIKAVEGEGKVNLVGAGENLNLHPASRCQTSQQNLSWRLAAAVDESAHFWAFE